VTEPDPVAALAAQLDELRGQLARYTGETGHLRARLAEDSGQVVMLRLEIKQLAEKIDEQIDAVNARRQAEKPQAPYWLGLTKDEHAARLARLRAWVDQVGLVQYAEYFGKLPPCWPSHPAAVIELSTVMAEWVRIYGDPDSRPLPDALVWNDKWLPGVLGRLAAAIKCDVSGCRLVQSSPWERSPPRYT
jgi:regulator of replication initiation timing